MVENLYGIRVGVGVGNVMDVFGDVTIMDVFGARASWVFLAISLAGDGGLV